MMQNVESTNYLFTIHDFLIENKQKKKHGT